MDLGIKNLTNTRSLQENLSHPCRRALGERCAPESRGEDPVRDHPPRQELSKLSTAADPLLPVRGRARGWQEEPLEAALGQKGNPGSGDGGRSCPCSTSEPTSPAICTRVFARRYSPIRPLHPRSAAQMHPQTLAGKYTRRRAERHGGAAWSWAQTALAPTAMAGQRVGGVGDSPACAPLSPKYPEFGVGKSFTTTKRQPCTH